MKRLLPLLLIPILVVWLAATSRPGHRPVEAPVPPSQQVASVTDDGRTGAPYVAPSAANQGGAPKPSGGIGEPASYCKPQFCETPPATNPGPIANGLVGEATWWYSFGPGIYTALRPDLGSKGDLVIVCGGAPFHCRTAPVITSCACLGPNSERLVDLSRDLFAEFADPARGVVRVVIQVIKGGKS